MKLFVLVFLSFISGCAGTSISVPDPASHSNATPVPLSYELLIALKPVRPVWIDQPPANKAGIHYLVGLSGYHVDERNAREDAMRHARQQFAQYTGVKISILDEMIESVYGKGSGILDSNLEIKNRATQSTDALVSRIKAEEWYWEKLRATQGHVYQGDVYKYWVKVSVPENEYERVQLWKKNRDSRQYEDKRTQQLRIQQTVEASLSKHSDVLTQIDQLLQTGNLRSALTEIQTENKRLSFQLESFKAMSLAPISYSAIKDCQNNLLSKITNIGSMYKIDVGKLGLISSVLGAKKVEIPVWVWACSEDECLPADGVPLVIYSERNKVAAKAITNNRGEVFFTILNPSSGTYSVKIDVDSASLSSLDQDILSRIEQLENRIVIKKVDKSLSGITKVAVQSLFSFPAYFLMPIQKIVVGPVTYKDTQEGGDFARLVQNEIIEQVVKIPEVSIVSPVRRNIKNIAKAMRTKGHTLSKKDSLGAVATHAVIDGADAYIEVTYNIIVDYARIKMQLKNTRTDELIATTTLSIPRKVIPSGINLFPPLNQNFRPLNNFSKGEINLQISSHLGDGQTYMEGEKISYFVNIDKSAFILLISEDAESNLIQILPNKYSKSNYYQAGSILEIPADQDPFEFIIGAPFGVETVWAFASNKKFPEFVGIQDAHGFKVIEQPLLDVLRTLRKRGQNPYVSYGEDQTVITTVSKNN